ncbi:MAG: hypothetical protein ACLP7P_12210 [Rhodomicrobium sp.]
MEGKSQGLRVSPKRGTAGSASAPSDIAESALALIRDLPYASCKMPDTG